MEELLAELIFALAVPTYASRAVGLNPLNQ